MKEAKQRESASLPVTQYPTKAAGATPCESVGSDIEHQAEQDSTDRAQVCGYMLCDRVAVCIGWHSKGWDGSHDNVSVAVGTMHWLAVCV